jgi:hypothetical protein
LIPLCLHDPINDIVYIYKKFFILFHLGQSLCNVVKQVNFYLSACEF